jgi:hypothetical protein
MMSFITIYLMEMIIIITTVASGSKSVHCLSTPIPFHGPFHRRFLTQTVEPTMLMRRVIPNFGDAGQDLLACRRNTTVCQLTFWCVDWRNGGQVMRATSE